MRQLSGFDAAFVSLENPRTPNHVALYFLYDPSTAPPAERSAATRWWRTSPGASPSSRSCA